MSKTTLAVIVLAAAGTFGLSCSSGDPAYCETLAGLKDLRSLSSALTSGNLDQAAAEAGLLRDAADEAPTEIRKDMIALAEGVTDVVDLLRREQDELTLKANETRPDSDVDRRRRELNGRLDELDRRSETVRRWAATECGIELSKR